MNLRPRAVNFDDVWPKLKETVEAIISLHPIERITWDHNFSDIYFVCVSVPESQSRRLYLAVRDCLELHTRKIREYLIVQTGDLLLSAYYREWCKYRQGANILHNLYGYLNKHLAKEKLDAETHYTFISDDSEGPFPHLSIGDLAFSIWRSDLINPLAAQLTTHIIDLIDKIRKGENSATIPNADIRGSVHSFVEVNQLFHQEIFSGQQKSPYTISGGIIETDFYEEIFERHFLEATDNYYRLLTNEDFAHLDCCPYMESIIRKMEEERTICDLLLHHSTLPKVEHLCTEILVSDQLEKINTMCREIVQKEMIHDLRNMYILLKPLSNTVSTLMHEFEAYVRKSGIDYIASTTNDAGLFVASITNLHEKFTRLVNNIFDGDGEYIASLDRAIQSVVNNRDDPKQPPKISERLNRYIDSLMRTKKGKTEQEIEGQLTRSIIIFRYIDDKDLFQKYYSKMLCNRLIGNLSFSMDLEESMINKMKEACGYEFTSKLSRMFTDITISQGLTKRFHEDVSKKNLQIDLPIYVMVLQAGAWPLTAPSTLSDQNTAASNQQETNGDYVPPQILQKSLKLFEEFYTASHSGRKLTWLYTNSTAEVQLNYLDRPYQATMGIYQLSILLLFSNQNAQLVSQIVQLCTLPLQTVLRAVKGLIEIGILTTSECELNESAALKLNTMLTSKRLNLKVAIPQSNKPQEKETESTCNTLHQDRKYYMECAIVRIMKARKVMKHNALVDEVINQTRTRFMPDIQFIKKNIEALIEKLYIQRTDQTDEYEYIS